MKADDDNNINNEGLEIAPSCVLGNIVTHNTSITPPILDTLIGNDHIPSPGSVFGEINGQYTCVVPVLMQYSVQQDSNYEKTNNQLPGGECRIDMAKPADEQNELDEHHAPVRRDRYSTSNSSSSDGQNEKSLSVIIEKQNAYFLLKSASLSNRWYLYRVNMSNNNDLGFIVPCELIKLPKFNTYENNNALTVQLVYIGSVNYTECENQLKHFCRYIFEQVFDDMNTGPESILKFDIEQSTFKLLPCLLKKSGELDYQRMALICERKNKVITDRSELNDQELYYVSDAIDKKFYMNIPDHSLLKHVSDPCEHKEKLPGTNESYADDFEYKIPDIHIQRDYLRIPVKEFKKPRINYLKKSSSQTNKEKESAATQINKPKDYSIELLRYAPLNQPDCELIYKLPSILKRISDLSYIEQLTQLLPDNIHSYSLRSVDRMPIVTFGDCLPQILSANQSTALSLDSLNYDLLLRNKCEFQPSPDLLFQSTTELSADENTNMDSLENLGDRVLEFAVSVSLYHRYPFDSIEDLTEKKNKEVSNENLYRLSVQKGLTGYLNSVKTLFRGENANWIPPGYAIEEQNSNKYLKHEVRQKALADMIEALISVVLISKNYSTTLHFMKWLGLDVIPTDEQDGVVKIPSVLRITEANDINTTETSIEKIYVESSFIDIEAKIKYNFNNKAYLIAAFTHPLCSTNAVTINYKRLKFVGNPLLQLIITCDIFVTKKSVLTGYITKSRQALLNKKQKTNVMIANDLHKKIILPLSKPVETISASTVDKGFSTDENNINERNYSKKKQAAAGVFDALAAAIFFDAGCCLKTVWRVIEPLLQPYIHIDSSIENPNLNVVPLVHEKTGSLGESASKKVKK